MSYLRLGQGIKWFASAGLLASTTLVWAFSNPVSYSGQGLIQDGSGGYDLRTELCGVQNGADRDGPYLLWVLTATGAANADITGPWGTVPMTKSGSGTFKYISSWYAPSTLPSIVSATYDGKSKNAQLVISHGCRPFDTIGAWCSPGFWGRAQDKAWQLIGVARASATFGGTVQADSLFVATDPTRVATVSPDLLQTILTANTPADNAKYKGASIGTFKDWAANAFNLTGGWLTNQIPDYSFDPTLVNRSESDTCPIDHHGNLKK